MVDEFYSQNNTTKSRSSWLFTYFVGIVNGSQLNK